MAGPSGQVFKPDSSTTPRFIPWFMKREKVSKREDEGNRMGRGWGQWSASTLERGPEFAAWTNKQARHVALRSRRLILAVNEVEVSEKKEAEAPVSCLPPGDRQVALLRCATGRKENTWSRVQPLLGACLSRKGACTSARAWAKSPKFTVYPVPTDTISPHQSPPSGYFLVSQAGVRVCATKSLIDRFNMQKPNV